VKKLAVVINGAGGVGKDTLCNFAAEQYKVRNVSSVDPIKDLARQAGWDGDKSDKSRKMLSDLKMLFTQYNDLPLRYITQQYRAFLEGDEDVLFVHIREPEEIARFVAVDPERIRTLLITRSNKEKHVYQNASDDNVENFQYDGVYDNCLPLDETKDAFLRYFNRFFEDFSKM